MSSANYEKRLTDDIRGIDTCLSRFLFQYRITAHSTTGKFPAELAVKGKNHGLTWIFPSVEQHLTQNHSRRQIENDDVHTRLHSFQVVEKVHVIITEECLNGYQEKSLQCWAHSILIVRFDDGVEIRYHVDHVKARIQGEEGEPETF